MKRKGLAIAGLVAGLSVLTSMSAFAGVSLIKQNGEWFSVDTGWKQDSTGWWYVTDEGTYPVSTWMWIDEDGYDIKDYNCVAYYFNENGYLVTNTIINGYTVNADGAWTVDSVVQAKDSSEISTINPVTVAPLGSGSDYPKATPKPDEKEPLVRPEDAIIERQPVTETEPVEIRPGEDYQTAQFRHDEFIAAKRQLAKAKEKGIEKYMSITEEELNTYSWEQLIEFNRVLFYDLR